MCDKAEENELRAKVSIVPLNPVLIIRPTGYLALIHHTTSCEYLFPYFVPVA
jgi:hypothetical protein